MIPPERLLARVSVGVAAGVAAIAAVTGFAFPGGARTFLGFDFPGVPRTFEEAAGIFGNNLRVMLAAFVCCFIVQWPWLEGHGKPGAAWRRLCRAADGVVAFLVALNVTVVGLAVGGYGLRMVAAMLPHGPVELLAFSGALTLYLIARQQPLRSTTVLRLGGGSVVVLAVAAALEVYGQ